MHCRTAAVASHQLMRLGRDSTASSGSENALAGRLPLKDEGALINHADLAFLCPSATSNLKRFGDYPTDLKLEPMPAAMTLPV